MTSIDEAIESLKSDYEIDMYIRDIAPQLAEWLEELQLYKQGNCTNDCEHFDNGVKYGYEKGIDDFIHSYYEYCEKQYGRLADDEMVDMQKVSEKLKDGGKYGR